MEKLYKLLTEYLINCEPNREILFKIFEFLKQVIPFERIACHSIDRKTRLFTTFIEYSFNEKVPVYSYYLNELLPLSVLESMLGENHMNIVEGKDHPVPTFIKELPYPIGSYIAFSLYVAEDKDQYMLLGFYSSKENAFSQQDVELVKFVRPYLKKILLELFLDNPHPHIYLATVGALPATFEEQLRACPGMDDVMKKVDTVAQFDSTILINGPSGSGKELVAEVLHSSSPRKLKPLVKVNCGAIPDSLVESELFGFEKGAFTGALQLRKGYFEQANGGTIYLDEIGELSKTAQTRLLRVLENRTIQRIGSERIINLDIRIISATHRNLWQMVQDGEFREDLYYRLAIFPIDIPPLKQRKEDIPVLIKYFYSFYTKKFQLVDPPVISYKTVRSLIENEWAGNVRQLRSAIERGILEALSDGSKEIKFKFLPDNSALIKPTGKKNYTAEEIFAALEMTKGKIQGKNGAAELLSINPATLRSRMKVLGIEYKKPKN